MISGNIIIAFVLMQYLLFFISLKDKTTKDYILSRNIRIEELRKIPEKTISEQKEFLKLKQGKLSTAKWRLIDWIRDSLKYTGLFLLFFIPLQYSTFRPNLWLTLIISIIVSLIVNKILTKYNLQRQDGIDVLFK